VTPLAKKRTKIVATIGPASRDPLILRELFRMGVNVARLNFSHGTHDEHRAVIADVRRIAGELGVHIAVLQDLLAAFMLGFVLVGGPGVILLLVYLFLDIDANARNGVLHEPEFTFLPRNDLHVFLDDLVQHPGSFAAIALVLVLLGHHREDDR